MTDQPTPPAVPDDRFDEATLACLVKWAIEFIEEEASNATWCEPLAAGFRNRALALRIIHQRLAHAEAALAAEREARQRIEFAHSGCPEIIASWRDAWDKTNADRDAAQTALAALREQAEKAEARCTAAEVDRVDHALGAQNRMLDALKADNRRLAAEVEGLRRGLEQLLDASGSGVYEKFFEAVVAARQLLERPT